MGKYVDNDTNILGIFGSTEWIAEGVKTVPGNFSGGISGNFIRISIISGKEAINLASLSGMLMVEIYTESGVGPKSTSLIADKLDTYLVGKSFKASTGVTQFMNSNLVDYGTDKDNPSLNKALYSIPFNYFY